MQAARGTSLIGDDNKSAQQGRRIGALLAVAAVVVALDQGSKILAVTRLSDGQVVDVIGDFLQLRLVRNSGAAFGLAADATIVFTIITVIVIAVILRLSRRLTSTAWAIALGGFLGGALGNLVDRIFREPSLFKGHVVDFLELPNWPVFNLADTSIVGAAMLVAVLSLRGIPLDAVPEPHVSDDTPQEG